MVAAVLIVMLAVGPSLDALICRDEPSGPVAGSAQMIDIAAAGDSHGSPASKHPDGVCAHGHCHHGVAYAWVNADAAAAPAVAPERHPLRASTQLASTTPSGLERPPRA
jgi:hypothetical protein